jgi:pimeloyl-ACP methyl ester carboxylesterase
MESTSATTTYHRAKIGGVGVFYREAGPKDAPTILLLHGFPSSSREFDTLIPLLATRYHLIAPDFPGFGQSDAPPPSSHTYTFDGLANTTNALLKLLKIDRCIFFLHDYGGPVGFRIFLAHPERVQALIIQNANAYKQGLGEVGRDRAVSRLRVSSLRSWPDSPSDRGIGHCEGEALIVRPWHLADAS